MMFVIIITLICVQLFHQANLQLLPLPSSNQLANYAATHPNDTTVFAQNVFGITYPTLSYSLGVNGMPFLQDQFLIEKLQSLNRERIPERVVHAKGAGELFRI
ncbi:hypothetical protein HA402_011009 [Bradysia odoriphaga]|nr:hypothetical protein HA402_011009 [Bradysia odoriphaga]